MANFGWSLPAGCNTLPGEEPEFCPICGKSEGLMNEDDFIETDGQIYCDRKCYELSQNPEEHEKYLQSICEAEREADLAFMKSLEGEGTN